ncbi:hypothetical protein [Streptomyces zhihengii]|uniref:Uncharacterized protein n=1 Tax=Streptomyces zhihengii TaxID=1818004 RepID=A0ABS2V0G8_9ACTN|nr:hypothetical protein [Streptomyces zhihengii]MBM9623189.1 hypothetical protein [Streptomyces zhihengii]
MRSSGVGHITVRSSGLRRRDVLAWAVLALGIVAAVAGMALPNGILLAAGLVLAGSVSLSVPPTTRRRIRR